MKLEKLEEPQITFGFSQSTFDPRDGLTLFGPYSQDNINEIHVGLIGTKIGIERGINWIKNLEAPIYCEQKAVSRPFYPGFSSAFNAKLNVGSTNHILVLDKDIDECLRYSKAHVRIFKLCDLFCTSLIKHQNEEDFQPHLWLVIIPHDIYIHGRPKSGPAEGVDLINIGFKNDYSKSQPKLFAELAADQEPYKYEADFHDQLKVRLLKHGIITQIALETKIAFRDFGKTKTGRYKYDWELQESSIAWNLSNAIYYKAGGIPWKSASARKGVCYLGLVFKKIDHHQKKDWACCAAQMFLDSGDGMIFRGNNGPWIKREGYGNSSFHLNQKSAGELLSQSLDAFKDKNGVYPEAVFIHSKTFFNDQEWEGFLSASAGKTKIYGVRIREEYAFKLYREHRYPILRGMMLKIGKKAAYLYTRGYIPRLKTQLGLEVPNPLDVRVVRGDCDIETVCKDILTLTKLNYNSCIYCDGKPVTLRFADKIGEILTSTEEVDGSVKTFKNYI